MKKITITFKDNKIFTGSFYIKNDSVISIGKETFFFKDVVDIRRGKGRSEGGESLTILGFMGDIIGLIYHSGASYGSFAGLFAIISETTLLISIPVTTIGIILICQHRNFKKDKWEMKIVLGN